jgi:hypothetical protein
MAKAKADLKEAREAAVAEFKSHIGLEQEVNIDKIRYDGRK